jgi:hypothetical protein
MDELIWMSTVLRYGRKEVSLKKKESTAMNLHANKPCPEMAARMGMDVMDTVLPVSV